MCQEWETLSASRMRAPRSFWNRCLMRRFHSSTSTVTRAFSSADRDKNHSAPSAPGLDKLWPLQIRGCGYEETLVCRGPVLERSNQLPGRMPRLASPCRERMCGIRISRHAGHGVTKPYYEIGSGPVQWLCPKRRNSLLPGTTGNRTCTLLSS